MKARIKGWMAKVHREIKATVKHPVRHMKERFAELKELDDKQKAARIAKSAGVLAVTVVLAMYAVGLIIGVLLGCMIIAAAPTPEMLLAEEEELEFMRRCQELGRRKV